jgi:hypothetical protein
LRNVGGIVALLLVSASAGCGGGSTEEADRTSSSTTTGAAAPLEVFTEWECIATPGDLAARAELVVIAQPVVGEAVLTEEPTATNGRVEVLAASMEVTDVLAGTGLAPGDQLVLTRKVEYQPVTVDGVTQERQVGGDGYPGPPVADAYVLGIVRDGGAWAAIAGAHGRVALDGAGDDATVLRPTPGADGRLQSEYSGETVRTFKGDLAEAGAESPCEAEDEHGHD